MEFKIKQNPFRLKIQRGFVYGLRQFIENCLFFIFVNNIKICYNYISNFYYLRILQKAS